MLLQTIFSPLDKLLAESGREPDDVQEAPSSPLDSLLAETESRELREPPPAARDAMPAMPRPPERLSGLEGLGPQTPEEQAELDQINAEQLGVPLEEYVARRTPRDPPPPPTAGEQATTGRLIGPTPEGFQPDRGAIEPVEEPGGFSRFFSSLGRRAAENFPVTGEFARSRGIETPTQRRERLLNRARAESLAFDSPEELGEIVGPQSKTETAGEMIGSVVDPTILIPFVGGERLALKAWQEAARRGVPGAGRFIRAAAAEADAPLRARLGAAAVRGAGTMGTGAAAAEVPHRLREEDRLPTPGEVGVAFGAGTVAGPVIAPAGELLATGGRAAVRALRGPAGEAGVAEAASTLGVKPGATAEEIHAAYRAAARRHHPDVGDGDRAAFEAATAAYETLGAGRVDLAPQQGIFRRFADAARQAWDRATGGRAGTGAGAGAEPAPGQPGVLAGPRAAEPAGARPAPRPEAPAPEPVRPTAEAEFVGPRELVGPQPPTGPVRVERGAAGIVPDQLDPRKAFQTRMTPRRFLDIAAPRPEGTGAASRAYLAGEMEAGRPIGAPFIEVRVRTASGLTGHDALQSGEPLEFEAVQHEGRNRAEVLAEQLGDEEIPVSILFRDRVRASDFSPEQLDQLRSAEILPEARGREPATVDPEAIEAGPQPGQERPPRRAAHGGLAGPEVRVRATSDLVPDVPYDVLATYRYATEAIEHAENLAPGAVEVLQSGPEQFQIIRAKSPNARLIEGRPEARSLDELLAEEVPPEVIDEVDADIAAEESQRAIDELTGPETAPERWPESTEERMSRDIDRIAEAGGIDPDEPIDPEALAQLIRDADPEVSGRDVLRAYGFPEAVLDLVPDQALLLEPELLRTPRDVFEALVYDLGVLPEELIAAMRTPDTPRLDSPTPMDPTRQVGPASEGLAAPDVPEAIEVGGRPAVSAGPDGAVYATVRAGDVMRDPDRFQFKRVNREGVVEHLRGDFDPFLSGTIDVIRDPADGKLYVFEGHHRHLAAIQAGEDTPISVRIHDFTEAQARKMGALKNIAEGNATPTDAARFIREEGITPETLDSANIDLRKDVARLGMQLANLPDDVFTRVATGDLTERMGTAIGDSGLSEAGMQALEKLVRDQPDLTIQQVRELARFVEGAGETTASQETLFGTEELTRSNALEKAKLSASIKRRLARDRSLFNYVARPGRAERLEQAGAGEIELEKAKDLAQSAASLEELYTKLSTVTGPVSDALNAAAQELAAGGSERSILDRLYGDVVDAIKADTDVGRIGGVEPPDPNQQSLLGEGVPEYGPEAAPRREPSPEMLEGPIEQWDPDPAKVRAAFDRFSNSRHNVSFDEVLDYLPEAAAKKPWDTAVAGRAREDRIKRGEPPMSKEQHAVAQAISDLSRGKGLELRTLDEQARALEGPDGPAQVRERSADDARAEALRDRLDEIDRITQEEGRDETPAEVEEIMRILDELNDIAPSGPTYDAPISVPRQPGEVGEAQGEYEALRRRFVAAFKHPDTGEIIKGATHITAAREHPDEMRLLDEWDRETPNVGFVDRDGTFYTRAEAERMLPDGVIGESQSIANYQRQNVFGRGRGEVREDATYEPGPERFESRVAAAVRAAPFNAAPGSQWQGYLSNVEGGISPVEADAIGLTRYLAENADTKLTRDEMAEFVAEHGIQLGETVRGGKRADWQADADWPTPEISELHAARQQARHDRAMAVADLTEALKEAGYSPTDVVNLTGPGAELVAPLPSDLDLRYREAIRDIQDFSNARQVSFASVMDSPVGPAEEDAVKFYREVKAQVDEARAGPIDPDVAEAFDAAIDARMDEARADRLFADASTNFAQGQPKYEEFVLPGEYDNYREILVTLDRPGEKWVGPHWAEPNVAVHLRVTDRTTTDREAPRGSIFRKSGEKALLVEEIQSDWAQLGRERGFRDRNDATNELPPGTEMYEYDNSTGHYYQAVWRDDSGRRGSAGRPAQSHEEAVREAWRERDRETLPYTPLNRTQDWVGIALQRALDEAVSGGYEHLAWTTGVQQAERYDIGRELDELQWRRFGDDILLIGYKDNKKVLGTDLKGAVPAGATFRFELGPRSEMATLEEVVGKDLARQIRDTPDGGYGKATGDDLAVGAHGMRMFYDAIVPREITKILKRLGVSARPEYVEIPNEPPWPEEAGDDFDVHAVRITPEIRDAVRSQSMRIMEQEPDYGRGLDGPGELPEGAEGPGQFVGSAESMEFLQERLNSTAEGPVELTPEEIEHLSKIRLTRPGMEGPRRGPRQVREGEPAEPDVFDTSIGMGDRPSVEVLGHAARWDPETQTLVGIHVTGDPARVRAAVESGADLTESSPSGGFYDLGPGLYVSGVPQKWRQRGGDNPQEVVLHLRGRFKDVTDMDPPIAQEYLRRWKDGSMGAMGAGTTRQIARDFVAQGYDGAFTRAGEYSMPQLVVWNADAIVKADPYSTSAMEQGGQGEVREGLGQEDLFGGTAPAEGGDQFGMGLEGPRPEGLSQAEQRAQTTVGRLRPLVEGRGATPEQIEEYREALALLNRDQPLRADEITLRSQEPVEPDDSGDLFGGLEGPAGVREPDPAQGDIFHDNVTWGGAQQANTARQKIMADNRALLDKLDPARRAKLVGLAEDQLRANLELDITGTVVRGPADIAALQALFRSPQRENLSAFLFTQDPSGGFTVVGHMMVTTGEIGSAGMSKGQTRQLFDMIDNLGATHVALAHNHPSGDPTPSNEDKTYTMLVEQALKENGGVELIDHIIVDHGTARTAITEDALTYDATGMVDWTTPIPNRLNAPSKVAAIAGKITGTDGLVVTYTDSQFQPVAMEFHPNGNLPLLEQRTFLTDRVTQLGAKSAFVTVDEANPMHDQIVDALVAARKKTLFGVGPMADVFDVVTVRGDQDVTSTQTQMKWQPQPRGVMEGRRVLEGPTSEYGGGAGEPPEGPPAPPATGGSEPPERPGRPRGVETGPYAASDFLRTTLNMTGLDRETERLFIDAFERGTAATGTQRRRVSDEEVIAHAHAIGQDGEALVRVLSEQGLSGSEQLALLSTARENTKQMAEALSRLSQGTSESGGPLGEAERLELERQVERRVHLNNTLLSKWAEEGSEAGRTLRARQLEAFAIDDPIAVLGLARRLKQRSGGRPEELTADEQGQIVAALETGNKEQLAEYLTALDKQSPISKFFAVIKAMMLSLIQTHNVNLSSNAIKHVMGPAERFYASLADRAIAAQREQITGESFGRTTKMGRGELEGPKAFRESVPRAGRAWWYAVSGNVPKGQGEDIIESLRRATSHRTDVRRRIELIDPMKRISDREGVVDKGIHAGGWAVQTFTNGVLGALGAGDVLFRHPAYIRSLWEQAGIHARRAGLDEGTPEFTEMVHRLVEDPTGAMERQAELDSNESVFMDPTGFFDGVDDVIQKIKRGETAMGRPGQVIAESLAPFTRTLLGIADQTTDLTGLGILRGAFNASKLLRMIEANAAQPDKQMGLGQDPQNALDPNNPEDAAFIARIDAAQKRASKQLGRGMLGATAFTLIAMMGSWLALRDRIKTRYPRDRREMELWRAQDIRPNSILIDGKWRQTDFLGPYGLALMIGAYATDIMTAAEDQRDQVLAESVRLATSLAESMMHVIGAVTIAQGLETVSELTAGEEGSFEEYARSIVRMPFPNILRGVARAIDPVRREADWQDPLDQYGASTPGVSQTYPPRVDMLGRDIVGPEGVWANIFSPSRGAREDRRLTDPLLRELDRLGTAPIRPRRSDAEGWAAAAGIELTPDQWHRIQKRYGEAMADITRRTIDLPSYQRADDDAKRATLERLWTSAKTGLNRELKSDIAKRARQTNPRLQGPRPAVGAP